MMKSSDLNEIIFESLNNNKASGPYSNNPNGNIKINQKQFMLSTKLIN